MDTDFNLLSRYHAHGEAAAFTRLVETHAGMVFSVAKRVTRDAMLAEDVAQETFIELARRGRDVRESVGAWLHRVAWRKACNVVRHESIRQRHEHAAYELNTSQTESAWEEMEPMIDAALDELPDQQREVILAHYFQGMTQQVLAQKLGVSQSTVSRVLDTGVAELRSKLRAKGLFCGAGLAAMLSAHAAEAAPTSLHTALSKLAVSGLGVASSTSLLAWLMRTPLAQLGIGVVVVAVVAVIGMDLASSPSRLQMWWAQLMPESPKPSVSKTVAQSDTAQKPDPEAAAANALWANVQRFADARALTDMKKRVMLENDLDRKFALLHQMGIKVSRAAFDRWHEEAATPKMAYRREIEELLRNTTGLFNEFVALWAEEDPLSATAWLITQTGTSGELREVFLAAGKSAQLKLGPWRAMLEGIDDPEAKALAELVLKSLEGQDQLLGCLGKGVSAAALQDDDFVTSLALNRFGNQVWTPLIDTLARLDNKAFLGIALKRALEDSNKPFRQLALQGLSSSPKFANLFKACISDPTADFAAALKDNAENYATQRNFRVGAGVERFMPANGPDFRHKILRGWSAVDPQAALQAAIGFNDATATGIVVEFMNKAHVNEAKVLSWLTDAPEAMRDAALTALYLRQGKGPMGQLKLIMNSEALHDQVKAAEKILLRWAKTDAEAAGNWLMRELPPGPERAELTAKLAPLVAAVNPQAAMEMANQDEMKDGDWKHATSQAVQHFALKNDVSACTRFIQQFGDVDQYQDALGQVAAIKF